MVLPNKIGRYEISEKLGVGGMGEVFLARDISLDRKVAVKVMPDEFADNSERLNRFKLEARAISSINHPNIITIHEIGEDNGKLFIVTEFIKGETLRNLIERSALDLNSSLKIAEQIAAALAAAHTEGIVHRDIKPENIMVRKDGIVKVLDFGLAKPTIVGSEDETRELVSTKAGLIMGSAAYMSPEQARGKEVDLRTDLWSLGVCLYEMQAKKSPFSGETMTDVLANIIHKEPVPLTELIQDVPTELQRILKKSLRKDREERYQTAKDFLLDLKNLGRELELEHELEISILPDKFNERLAKSGGFTTNAGQYKATDEVAQTKILSEPVTNQSQAHQTKNSSNRVSMILYSFIGLVLLGTLTFLSSFFFGQETQRTKLTDAVLDKLPIRGKINGLEFSPDGKYLAYVEGNQGSKSRLVLRQFETGSEKDILPFEESSIMLTGFSPDSNYLYYRKNERGGIGSILYRVPILGGEPKKIAFDVDSGVSFSPDAKQIVFHRHKITPKKDEFIFINAEGGEEKIVFSSENNSVHPQLSPDGKFIVFSTFDENRGFSKAGWRLAWIPSEGGTPQFIGDDYYQQIADYRWLRDGSGLLVSGVFDNESNYQIFTKAFPNGEISRITKDTNDYYGTSVTADGSKIAVVKWQTVSGIWEFDTEKNSVRQILANNQEYKGYSSLAANSEGKVLYSQIDGKDNVDLWQMNTDGSNIQPLLTGKETNRIRSISSDNKTLFIEAARNNSQDIWSLNSDGTNEINITQTPDKMDSVVGLMPDNKSLIFQQKSLANSEILLIKHNLVTKENTVVWDDDKFFLETAQLSPDGKKLLYIIASTQIEANNMPRTSLTIADFDGAKISNPTTIQKVVRGNMFRFSPDGKSIYFIDAEGENSDLMKQETATGKISKFTNFNLETIFRYAISPDGKKFYLTRGSMSKEPVLIRNNK